MKYFYAKGLTKNILGCSISIVCCLHIFLHLFFYQCFLVPLIIIFVNVVARMLFTGKRMCVYIYAVSVSFDSKQIYIVTGFTLNCWNAQHVLLVHYLV